MAICLYAFSIAYPSYFYGCTDIPGINKYYLSSVLAQKLLYFTINDSLAYGIKISRGVVWIGRGARRREVKELGYKNLE